MWAQLAPQPQEAGQRPQWVCLSGQDSGQVVDTGCERRYGGNHCDRCGITVQPAQLPQPRPVLLRPREPAPSQLQPTSRGRQPPVPQSRTLLVIALITPRHVRHVPIPQPSRSGRTSSVSPSDRPLTPYPPPYTRTTNPDRNSIPQQASHVESVGVGGLVCAREREKRFRIYSHV